MVCLMYNLALDVYWAGRGLKQHVGDVVRFPSLNLLWLEMTVKSGCQTGRSSLRLHLKQVLFRGRPGGTSFDLSYTKK